MYVFLIQVMEQDLVLILLLQFYTVVLNLFLCIVVIYSKQFHFHANISHDTLIFQTSRFVGFEEIPFSHHGFNHTNLRE